MGITKAVHLRDAPDGLILERFGVALARTQRELQGIPCAGIEEIEPDRRQIMVSRSFGERVEDHEAVGQAIASFTIRACEKLRTRGLATSAISVFASSDPFRPELRQHHPQRTTPLPTATADTTLVLGIVRRLHRGMLRDGVAYKRAGIILMDLARSQDMPGDLFSPAVIGNTAMMNTMDRINRRFGSGSVGLAASGWESEPAWGMRQRSLSPCYTTRLADLARVTC